MAKKPKKKSLIKLVEGINNQCVKIKFNKNKNFELSAEQREGDENDVYRYRPLLH